MLFEKINETVDFRSHLDFHFQPDKDPALFLEEMSSVFEKLQLENSIDTLDERLTIWECARFELVLCHWKPFSKRDWHTHPETRCWFKCLIGEITEYRTGEILKRQAGVCAYIDDSLGGHQIENMSASSAVTFHIYKKIEYNS